MYIPLTYKPRRLFSGTGRRRPTRCLISCRSLSPKEPLIIGLFCRKRRIKIRHPMGLRRPVCQDPDNNSRLHAPSHLCMRNAYPIHIKYTPSPEPQDLTPQNFEVEYKTRRYGDFWILLALRINNLMARIIPPRFFPKNSSTRLLSVYPSESSSRQFTFCTSNLSI